MKWTKNWGTVSGNAELHMLNHAEHHRKYLSRLENRKNESGGKKRGKD